MKAIRIACFFFTIIVVLQFEITTVHANPITSFIGQYLLGRVVDYGWDKATGKPDIREIDRRLHELEIKFRQTNPGIVPAIEDLRKGITPNTSKEDYERMVQLTLRDIDRRLGELERRAGSAIVDSDIKEVKDLSRYYHRQYVRGNKDEMMQLYGFPIYFFEHNLCSQSFVDSEWENYFARWTEREASVESLDVVSQSSDKIKMRLRYRYHWKDSSWRSKRGTAISEILWQKNGSEWKIKAVNETRP